jgi:hypothetical protein
MIHFRSKVEIQAASAAPLFPVPVAEDICIVRGEGGSRDCSVDSGDICTVSAHILAPNFVSADQSGSRGSVAGLSTIGLAAQPPGAQTADDVVDNPDSTPAEIPDQPSNRRALCPSTFEGGAGVVAAEPASASAGGALAYGRDGKDSDKAEDSAGSPCSKEELLPLHQEVVQAQLWFHVPDSGGSP